METRTSEVANEDKVHVVVKVEKCGHSTRVAGHRFERASPAVRKHMGGMPFGELMMELARFGYETMVTREVVDVSAMHWFGVGWQAGEGG